MASQSLFSRERRYFEQNKSKWLRRHRDCFVAIYGIEHTDFYADYSAALRAGLQTFGLGKRFMVKQVLPKEPVYVVH